MPVTTPPTIDALPEAPLRNQPGAAFNNKAAPFVAALDPMGDQMDAMGVWMEGAANQTETWANAAGVSETNAAASAGLSDTARINAQAAQAAAEYAAGLPPVNTIGQIFHTQPELNVKTTAFTATTGNIYDIDSIGGAFDITLKASPSVGDWHEFYDYSATYHSSRPVVKRNGQLIMGLSEDMTLNRRYTSPRFVFRGGSKGWIIQ